ncbi:MAG: TOBE domain-containing protein, partial [Microthrixaceae bacterium]
HPGAVPGSVAVMLRPEQIVMLDPGSDGSVDASVESVTYFGHDALLRLRTEANGTEVSCRTTRDDLPAVGERVGLVVIGEVSVFDAQ